jgi:hypothetical protein
MKTTFHSNRHCCDEWRLLKWSVVSGWNKSVVLRLCVSIIRSCLMNSKKWPCRPKGTQSSFAGSWPRRTVICKVCMYISPEGSWYFTTKMWNIILMFISDPFRWLVNFSSVHPHKRRSSWHYLSSSGNCDFNSLVLRV